METTSIARLIKEAATTKKNKNKNKYKNKYKNKLKIIQLYKMKIKTKNNIIHVTITNKQTERRIKLRKLSDKICELSVLNLIQRFHKD